MRGYCAVCAPVIVFAVLAACSQMRYYSTAHHVQHHVQQLLLFCLVRRMTRRVHREIAVTAPHARNTRQPHKLICLSPKVTPLPKQSRKGHLLSFLADLRDCVCYIYRYIFDLNPRPSYKCEIIPHVFALHFCLHKSTKHHLPALTLRTVGNVYSSYPCYDTYITFGIYLHICPTCFLYFHNFMSHTSRTSKCSGTFIKQPATLCYPSHHLLMYPR